MELSIIQSKIYEIRGVKVMIDRDLAEMYQVETRTLNQAVKRNIDRFPSDFMFQLTKEELKDWKSQIVISNSENMGLRRPPFAFTELGVAMLSSVLSSSRAIQVNINIMRAFVAFKELLLAPANDIEQLQNDLKELKTYIEDVFKDYNDTLENNEKSLDEIYYALSELAAKQKSINTQVPRRPVGYIQPNETTEE